MTAKRLIVGVTGATGAIYALRLLQAVRTIGGVETHLVISASGILNVEHEIYVKEIKIFQMCFSWFIQHVFDVNTRIKLPRKNTVFKETIQYFLL